MLTRRTALRNTLAGAFYAGFLQKRPFAVAQGAGGSGVTPAQAEMMKAAALAFMKQFNVPGLSVCFAKQGSTSCELAFGVSELEKSTPLSSGSLFRIASVTKPITSVAIFSLIEAGKLKLTDKIFGSGAVLGTKYGTRPYSDVVLQITLEHLLTHTCGGWDNHANDPMFSNKDLTQAQLISWVLDNRPLDHPPGTNYSYSNFGYCLLGRVIEQVSALPYAAFIQQTVLNRCHIGEMRIGCSTLQERTAGEVVYYGQDGEDPYSLNIPRMDSHGGWIATAEDLVRFGIQIDPKWSESSLLKADTAKTMWAGSSVNPGYAHGWMVNRQGNRWHNGSLPGTTSILVCTGTGLCWAGIANTRSQGGNDIGLALDKLLWEMTRKVAQWHV